MSLLIQGYVVKVCQCENYINSVHEQNDKSEIILPQTCNENFEVEVELKFLKNRNLELEPMSFFEELYITE